MQRAERFVFQANPSRCESGHGCHHFARVAQSAKALRRERRQCGCPAAAGPRAPFQAASIKVMQRTFNPFNEERYPGGLLFPSRLTSRMLDFESGDRGAEPRSGGFIKCFSPVGVIATRLAYIQKSEEHNLHGRPFSAVVRLGLLRGKAAREIGLVAGSNPAEIG